MLSGLSAFWLRKINPQHAEISVLSALSFTIYVCVTCYLGDEMCERDEGPCLFLARDRLIN